MVSWLTVVYVSVVHVCMVMFRSVLNKEKEWQVQKWSVYRGGNTRFDLARTEIDSFYYLILQLVVRKSIFLVRPRFGLKMRLHRSVYTVQSLWYSELISDKFNSKSVSGYFCMYNQYEFSIHY